MDTLGIIPARYASLRFPGKSLVDILGKSMIRRVYERASKVLNYVVVATDDGRIIEEVKSFGGDAVMTSSEHKSGTDRCWEALNIFEKKEKKVFKFILNVQGDEPFINPVQLELLKKTIQSADAGIATLIKRFAPNEDIFDWNKVKVVFSKDLSAIYFSRWPIPYIRDVKQENWQSHRNYYLHLGLYAYKRNALERITKLERSGLETAESLEQLRWLENGIRISVAETTHESYGIDTPEDLKKILKNGIPDA